MYTTPQLKKILTDVQKNKSTVKKALTQLKNLPYEDLSFAKLDHHRRFRKGYPEAIYAPGKTLTQLKKIIRAFTQKKQNIIVTRLEVSVYEDLVRTFPHLKYAQNARLAYLKVTKKVRISSEKPIVVLTAGTTDIPVAEEAALVLEMMNKKVTRVYDCGVAGLHRLLDQVPRLKKSKAVICVAGMEGALPSVVAGLIDRPVIAVPTSVGYGANFKGLAALLGMMNSCAEGVAVVNIDNGFGAACFAASLT